MSGTYKAQKEQIQKDRAGYMTEMVLLHCHTKDKPLEFYRATKLSNHEFMLYLDGTAFACDVEVVDKLPEKAALKHDNFKRGVGILAYVNERNGTAVKSDEVVRLAIYELGYSSGKLFKVNDAVSAKNFLEHLELSAFDIRM